MDKHKKIESIDVKTLKEKDPQLLFNQFLFLNNYNHSLRLLLLIICIFNYLLAYLLLIYTPRRPTHLHLTHMYNVNVDN
jgi:hypothetical protein